MCDYSAASVQKREAKVGDELRTSKISSHTTGLSSPLDPKTAVCLVLDTKVIIANLPADFMTKHGLRHNTVTATFTQREYTEHEKQTGHLLSSRDGLIIDGMTHMIFFQDLPLGVDVSIEMIPNEAIFEEPLPEYVAIPAPTQQARIPSRTPRRSRVGEYAGILIMFCALGLFATQGGLLG